MGINGRCLKKRILIVTTKRFTALLAVFKKRMGVINTKIKK